MNQVIVVEAYGNESLHDAIDKKVGHLQDMKVIDMHIINSHQCMLIVKDIVRAS